MAVAKIIELSSSSQIGFEDAVQQGIARADKTLNRVQGAWVEDMKVVVEDGKIKEYRVHLKVTFVLED